MINELSNPTASELKRLFVNMGSKSSKVASTGNSHTETKDTGVPNKPESTPTDTLNNKTTEKQREIERCKRCGVLYVPAQLHSPYVNTKCGQHHPGKS